MNEEWRPIKGYEGLYEVSNYGDVKSFRFNREKILKPGRGSHGYFSVALCKNSTQTSRLIHKLVAEAFIPNLENKPQVNHIDGDKTNNRVENLEWCTSVENNNHARGTGLNRSTLSKEARIKGNKAVEIIISWYNEKLNLEFKGNSMELVRAFPEMKLDTGNLSLVRKGKRKQHKGWTTKS